jgi:hypothetical protein
MKPTWRYTDLIDLEYFFQTDDLGEDETARRAAALRDRDIYLRDIRPRIEASGTLSRRQMIRAWLERRRAALRSEDDGAPATPGETFAEIYRLLVLAAVVFGIASGGGLAFSLLRYAGARPVNVSVYLSLLVGTQVLIIAVLAAGCLVRWLWRGRPPFPLLYGMLGALLASLVVRVRTGARRRISGRGRAGLGAVAGMIRGRRRTYGALFYWPLFVLAQIFGIAFNTGVLAATLLRVLGTDIAFGWQSSILFSADAVYQAVEAVALPWSWFVPPETAHPTLAQIVGSHMVLKDGIYHLATRDLVSWWPFLCLAVLFYGLIPRLLFLFAGILFKSRAMARLDFSHSRAEQLLQRMETPLLDTEGQPTAAGPQAPPAPESVSPAPPAAEDAAGPSDKGMVALIPEDIYEACPRGELEALTSQVFGSRIQETLRMGEADQALLARLSDAAGGNGGSDVFILKEAWQPPIREDIAFIQRLRQTVGERSRIRMGLIGRPAPGNIFTPVAAQDWRIWHDKIASLGDPYLRLERLVKHEA